MRPCGVSTATPCVGFLSPGRCTGLTNHSYPGSWLCSLSGSRHLNRGRMMCFPRSVYDPDQIWGTPRFLWLLDNLDAIVDTFHFLSIQRIALRRRVEPVQRHPAFGLGTIWRAAERLPARCALAHGVLSGTLRAQTCPSSSAQPCDPRGRGSGSPRDPFGKPSPRRLRCICNEL